MLKRRDGGETDPNTGDRAGTKYSVSIYIIIFVVVVLVLIFTSYFVQQRKNSQAISDLTEKHDQFSIQALQNIEDLQNRNLALTEELEQKDAEIEALEENVKNVRANWAEAVKTLEDGYKTEYNELEAQKRALEQLLNAEIAYSSGDEDGMKLSLEEIDPANLDGAYAEHYEWLMKKAGLGE